MKDDYREGVFAVFLAINLIIEEVDMPEREKLEKIKDICYGMMKGEKIWEE